jgi:hypothetical protein
MDIRPNVRSLALSIYCRSTWPPVIVVSSVAGFSTATSAAAAGSHKSSVLAVSCVTSSRTDLLLPWQLRPPQLWSVVVCFYRLQCSGERMQCKNLFGQCWPILLNLCKAYIATTRTGSVWTKWTLAREGIYTTICMCLRVGTDRGPTAKLQLSY